MPAEISSRRRADERRQRAWDLHLKGVSHLKIAAELGVTHGRVSHYIKEFAASHPVTKLDLNERIALSEARWQMSEDELLDAIAEQRRDGQVWREVTRHPDGSETVVVRKTNGVDPALLRALSTHHDRRARQLNNQLAPDSSVQQVQINVLKDFMAQGQGGAKLTPEQWNEQAAIDV
jgi:ATP-dependent DNA ligase